MKPSQLVVNATIALLCLIWGSTWLVIRVGLDDIPPLHGVALRFTVASALFWTFARPLSRREGGSAPPWRLVAVFGSLNFAASYGIVYWAETVIPSALASLLWAVFPMMMAVSGHLFLPGERLRGMQWSGFALGFLGVALLFRTDLRAVHADALWVGAVYLLSPLVSAVGQTYVKRDGAGVSSVLLNRNALALATVCHWIAALTIERSAEVRLTPPGVFSIVYLAVVGTFLGFGLYFWALRFTPAYKMSLIAYVTPVIALVLGWSVGDEPVGWSTLAGAGLVLGGVGLVRRGQVGWAALSRSPRIAVAAASTLLALGAGWYLLASRPGAPATGIVDDREEFGAFLAERAAHGGAEEAPLFGPIPEEDARKIFSGLKSEAVYEPEVYYVRAPDLRARREFPEHPGGGWVMHTNSQGFREDEELPAAPDARVVVLGDSHVDGACANRHSFANALERMLGERHPGAAIDVVNAGVGSHAFYNYLGGVTKYGRELAPDAIVVTVYGGNDFLGVLRPLHYFLRDPLPTGDKDYHASVDAFRKASTGRADRNLGQAIFQLSYFNRYPELAEQAVDTAIALTREMAMRADELGVALVFLYLPPLWDVQLERYEPDPELLFRALRIAGEGKQRTADAWADRWLAAARELDLTVVDLRPGFRAAEEELYWHLDYHISIAGHQRAAEALLPVVEPLLDL
jgi:drug/metabolite transporter (DMT)-like permease/lysophospholipase L1-like esterase